jgi:thiol-disulfide isomerase/thioredoxin
MLKNCISCNTVYEGDINSEYCPKCRKEKLYTLYKNNPEMSKIVKNINNNDIVNEESSRNINKVLSNKKSDYEKTCIYCNKIFSGKKTSKYCSNECRKSNQNNKQKVRKQKARDDKNKEVNKTREMKKFISKNNKSGYRGVYFDQAKQKWRSQIRFNNKCYKLGLHVEKTDAIRARQEAEIKFYGKILDDSEIIKSENTIGKYISELTDDQLINICNSLYDYLNNDFVLLYKQQKDSLMNIEILEKIVLQESEKRFYKLNNINKIITNLKR